MLTRLSLFFLAFLPLAAQEAELAPEPDQGFWPTAITVGIGVLFFYLIMWRPEMKQRKEQERKRESLVSGDRVVAMGIIGTVSKVQEDSVILKMHDGSKLEFLKQAISDVVPAESANE